MPPALGSCPGGATPPLFGSTPPGVVLGVPELGGVVDGVPVLGVAELGGVLVDGVPVLGVPPVASPDEPEPFWFFLFFFLSPGATGSPLVIGATTGTVSVELEFEGVSPPPLEAIAITTIRKKATPDSATSLRRL